MTTVLTAPRIWTLPAASAFAAGQRVTFMDEVAGVSATNTLTITAAGADTIDSVASYVLTTPSEVLIFMSDGVSKWFSIRQGVNTQRFTGAGGTWYNLPRAKNVRVRAIGPGGGGGGGPKVAAATSCSGGGSGAGGMDMEAWFNPANLAATVTVTVPAGGLGGAGATVLGAGVDGALASADSSFGVHLIAFNTFFKFTI